MKEIQSVPQTQTGLAHNCCFQCHQQMDILSLQKTRTSVQGEKPKEWKQAQSARDFILLYLRPDKQLKGIFMSVTRYLVFGMNKS